RHTRSKRDWSSDVCSSDLFIKPGLKKHERTTSLAYVPAVFFLFVMGLVFGYFLFIQLIVPFSLSLNDGMFNELFTVDKYFKFMRSEERRVWKEDIRGKWSE